MAQGTHFRVIIGQSFNQTGRAGLWIAAIAPVVAVLCGYWSLTEMSKVYNSRPFIPGLLTIASLAATWIGLAMVLVGRDYFGNVSATDEPTPYGAPRKGGLSVQLNDDRR